MCAKDVSRSGALAEELYKAVLDQDLRRTELLLVAGADPNHLLPDVGVTALHCAVGRGPQTHALRTLDLALSHGGDPNVRCLESTTPVHIAAFWGRLAILKLLISRGGDPLLRDDDGCDAVDYARKNKHRAVVYYLNSINECSNTKVDCSSISNSFSSVCLTDDYESCSYQSDTHLSTNPQCNINSIFDNGFMCSFADILSDIDSNIDDHHVVSVDYQKSELTGPVSKSSWVEYSSDSSCYDTCNEQDIGFLGTLPDCIMPISNNSDEVVNASQIHPSFSSSLASVDDKDLAFVGNLPRDDFMPKEELFTDDEAGIVLVQRKFPLELSDSEVSVKSHTSSTSASSYDTDHLCKRLKECNLFTGPVTKTTKRVYTRQLKRYNKSKFVKEETHLGTTSVLSRTMSNNLLQLLDQWSHLETKINEDFLSNPMNNKFRGGAAKCFFNYLLLDPRVTDNLPARANRLTPLAVWKTFIEAVFYVGKGKQSRPYAHLYEALKPDPRKPPSKKVAKVLDIWNEGRGVICLMVFHNTISAEALTREAAMIDVMESRLTNAQGGEYSGVAARWNKKQKCQLGAVLLYRALQIFLAEGERHLSPPDLEPRHSFKPKAKAVS